MPKLRGIEATREIKKSHPEIHILILTMFKDLEYLYHAINVGADGYLLKEDADEELFTAIESIRKGGKYISPLLSKEVTDQMFRTDTQKGQKLMDNLTTREKEILKLVAEGKSNKEIADLLYISLRTVQHHRASIMNKLQLKKTADLVKYAIRKGYTTLNI